MTKQVLKKYSVAFKRHVVSEYEQGKSAYELKKRYGISGNGTVERWVREYGREGLRHQVMRIQHVERVMHFYEYEVEVSMLKGWKEKHTQAT